MVDTRPVGQRLQTIIGMREEILASAIVLIPNSVCGFHVIVMLDEDDMEYQAALLQDTRVLLRGHYEATADDALQNLLTAAVHMLGLRKQIIDTTLFITCEWVMTRMAHSGMKNPGLSISDTIEANAVVLYSEQSSLADPAAAFEVIIGFNRGPPGSCWARVLNDDGVCIEGKIGVDLDDALTTLFEIVAKPMHEKFGESL
ncbi:hypothetical protein B0A49_10768 [Cryomyces minteri]|uniref:Uncharacterized protein n=1 Tax=Cryomyces minteri TaxID=331657 RepID=A0A4U0WPY3_9PEZI|nr:hypothetical protein B0A49_10768 [Cryomyces minteri]